MYNADGSTPIDVIGPGGQTPSQQRLYGNLVSSPHTLRNLQGRLGIYFLFPDVSIRWRGRFQLSVTLMRIPRYGLTYGGYIYTDEWLVRMDLTTGPIDVAEQGVVLAQARSHAFDVCPREEYVAPGEGPLSCHLFVADLLSTFSSDAFDAIFPPTGGPNVRLCISYPISGSASLRPYPRTSSRLPR